MAILSIPKTCDSFILTEVKLVRNPGRVSLAKKKLRKCYGNISYEPILSSPGRWVDPTKVCAGLYPIKLQSDTGHYLSAFSQPLISHILASQRVLIVVPLTVPQNHSSKFICHS